MTLPIMSITSGVIHPKYPARRALVSFLEGTGKYAVTSKGSIEAAADLDTGKYRAVVLYFHRKHISDTALDSLCRFVEAGGGILAVHSASASFKTCRRYFDLLGGRFTGHDEVREFTVSPSETCGEIFPACREFIIKDELYIHETCDGITVRYHADHEGGREPVVWTRVHGRGRVCYVSPGHCTPTMKDRNMLSVIEKGLEWACGEEEGNG